MRTSVTVEIVFGGHSIREEIPLSELGNPSPENLEEEASRYVLENISVWVETDEDLEGTDALNQNECPTCGDDFFKCGCMSEEYIQRNKAK